MLRWLWIRLGSKTLNCEWRINRYYSSMTTTRVAIIIQESIVSIFETRIGMPTFLRQIEHSIWEWNRRVGCVYYEQIVQGLREYYPNVEMMSSKWTITVRTVWIILPKDRNSMFAMSNDKSKMTWSTKRSETVICVVNAEQMSYII